MISKEILEMQSQLCKAMGHPARLEIVHILREGPQPVNGLVEAIGLSQASISRHLAALRQIGLVSIQQQGPEHIYTVSNPKVGLICDLMRQVLADQIAHQAEVAEKLPKWI